MLSGEMLHLLRSSFRSFKLAEARRYGGDVVLP
jgi:hypothetical protein